MNIKDFPLLPIRYGFFFPGSTTVLHVGRRSSVKSLKAAMAKPNKSLALFFQNDPFIEKPGLKHFHSIGVRAVVQEAKDQGETFRVVLEIKERIKLRDLSQVPFPVAQVEILPDQILWDIQGPDLHAGLLILSTLLFQMSGSQGLSAAETAAGLSEPYELVSFLATVLPLSLEEGLAILQADRLEDGQRRILSYISEHLKLAEEQEAFPWAIRNVAWSTDETESVPGEEGDQEEFGASSAQAFSQRLRELRLPHHIHSAVVHLLDRLDRAETESMEDLSVLTSLEHFFELPWNISTNDNLSPAHLRESFDKNLIGLETVKSRLAERACLENLGTKSKGVLIFCGPTGAGKRSTAEALAEGLGRQVEFLRLPKDPALSELNGRLWNSTLAGPGRLFEAMRKVGCQNPILVFETETLTASQLKLLVGLTKEANTDNMDDYLGLPLDFSKCAIIVLCETQEGLPEYLREDCEVIDFCGYTKEQKKTVAEDYLLPKLLDYAGLDAETLVIPEEVLEMLLASQSQERGVAGLSSILNTLVGKAALHHSQGYGPLLCDEELAREIVWGLPSPDLEHVTVAGLVRSLAATQRGGQVVEIESITIPDASAIVVTGLSGVAIHDTVLSVNSLLRTRGSDYGYSTAGRGLHVNLPKAVLESDYAGLGLALAVSLASSYLACPVRPGTAVVGQLGLTGRTAATLKLQEKILAAREAGLHCVVLPRANEREFLRLPESVTQGLDVRFARNLDEALLAAIPGLDSELGQFTTTDLTPVIDASGETV